MQTDILTAEQIQAIRERADKATPGPWGSRIDVGKRYYVFTPSYGVRDFCCLSGGFEREDDADFIAHARTDIPALLAALDTANARADKAVADLEWLAITTVDSLRCSICKYNPDDMGCELDGSQFEDDGECHFTYWRRAEQKGADNG